VAADSQIKSAAFALKFALHVQLSVRSTAIWNIAPGVLCNAVNAHLPARACTRHKKEIIKTNNKMKKVITVLVVAMAAFFSACQDPETDTEKAKDKVAEAETDLKTAQQEEDSVVLRAANEKEWLAFKAESDMKIKNTEDQVIALKEKLKKEGKAITSEYNNRIDSLEEKNRELKMRINSYSNNQTNWQQFKLEFNRDMEGLGQSLRNFVVPAKK
jgi:hypothetical protein